MEQTETSEAQEVFTRTCVTWLNVIGRLARTTTAEANQWVDNFSCALADYIEKGITSVLAGEVPEGAQLQPFCDTYTWRELALAVALSDVRDGEEEKTLEAVRVLHRAYEYHNAEEERRMAAWEASQKALAVARGNGPSSNGCGGEVTATSA